MNGGINTEVGFKMITKSIKIYTGKTVENTCGAQKSPLTEVENALTALNEIEHINCNSNSPDFCMALAHCRPDDCTFQIFVDGVESNLEGAFAEFNKALDLINEKSNSKYYHD